MFKETKTHSDFSIQVKSQMGILGCKYDVLQILNKLICFL